MHQSIYRHVRKIMFTSQHLYLLEIIQIQNSGIETLLSCDVKLNWAPFIVNLNDHSGWLLVVDFQGFVILFRRHSSKYFSITATQMNTNKVSGSIHLLSKKVPL